MSPERDGSLRNFFKDAEANDKWGTNWRVRLSREAKAPDDRLELIHHGNHAVIPRNHRIEQAIEAAVDVIGLRSLREALRSSLPSL